MKRLLIVSFFLASAVFGQSTASNLTAITASSPLDTDPISGGAGQIRGIKQATIGSVGEEHRLDGRHIRFFAMDSGSLNNVVLQIPFQTTSNEQGMIFTFLPAFTNTGPSTLTVINTNSLSLGTKNVLFNGATLAANTLIPSNICEVVFDGNNYQIIGYSSNVLNGVLSGSQYLIAYAGLQTLVNDTTTLTSLFTSQAPLFVPTNNYSYVKADVDVFFQSANDHNVQPSIYTINGVTTNQPITLNSVGANGSTLSNYAHFSFIEALPNGGTLDFKVQPSNADNNTGALLYDFQIFGIK